MCMFGGSTDPRTLSSMDFMLLRAICNKQTSLMCIIMCIFIFSTLYKHKNWFISSPSHSYLNPSVKLDNRLRVEMDLECSLPSTWHHSFRWTDHQAWQHANILHLPQTNGRQREARCPSISGTKCLWVCKCLRESNHLVVGMILSCVLQNCSFEGGHVEGNWFKYNVFVCQLHLACSNLKDERCLSLCNFYRCSVYMVLIKKKAFCNSTLLTNLLHFTK